jgi:2-phospho-L-lactate guanylyltransferase
VRTAAVLPVKRLAVAKRRLRTAVAEPVRGKLAHAMMSDVLDALARCAAIEHTIVVTADPTATATARAKGAAVLEDPAEDGQSVAAARGIKRALAEGYERVLCVPGDCPALEPRELDALLDIAAGGRPEVVIVPDRHGTGTNALVLTPPDAIPPAFGPDSFERHRRLAQSAGVHASVARPPSLVLDVDTGEDLAALRVRLAPDSARGIAVHTRALLASGTVAALR